MLRDMGCWSGGGRDRWVRSARPVRVMCHEDWWVWGFCAGGVIFRYVL